MLARKKMVASKHPPAILQTSMANKMTLQEFRSLGGKARAKSLSKKRRREIATKGSESRWDKKAKGVKTADGI